MFLKRLCFLVVLANGVIYLEKRLYWKKFWKFAYCVIKSVDRINEVC